MNIVGHGEFIDGIPKLDFVKLKKWKEVVTFTRTLAIFPASFELDASIIT